MKFHWGTGILLFLILFLLACAIFIAFALHQTVDLVHEDYYERGVNYTEQMNIDARSKPFEEKLRVEQEKEVVLLKFEPEMAAAIDSGKVYFYRPSDSNQDFLTALNIYENQMTMPKDKLLSGRYIIKISWFSKGLKYEVDKSFNVR
ncbi:MAG: hypothetical protein CSA36_08465 [Draconibacterium sp.]|nr:MAG: hypothetical protein CSA36_08465 [Draconibacterium sp.]